MKNNYIMHKVQDYNNSVDPVTCKGQHLTRMIKTNDLTFLSKCLSQANRRVIFHVCSCSNYCFCLPLWYFQVDISYKKFEDIRNLIGSRNSKDR